MVIGSVLLQPQRLERAAARSDSGSLMDDLMRLAVCLVKDAADGAPCLRRIEASIETTLAAQFETRLPGIGASVQRFGDLFDRLRGQVESFAADGFDDSGDFVDLLAGLRAAAIGSAESLTPDGMRSRVNPVFTIVSDDLGLNATFIEEAVWALFHGAILILAQPPTRIGSDAESPARRANRREISRLLRRIKHELQGLLIVPEFNADLVADALLTLLTQIGLDKLIEQVGCTGEAFAAAFRAGEGILDLVGYQAFPPFGEGGLGAAASPTQREQYCWYATWLLEYQNRTGDLGVLPATLASEFFDGAASRALRNALIPLSTVVPFGAFIPTDEPDKKWRLIDRRKYVIRKLNSADFGVFRLFEMSEGDFLEAVSDLPILQDAFRRHGFVGTNPITVVSDGSNVWTIDTPGQTYNAVRFSGTVTIKPTTLSGTLVQLPASIQPDLDKDKASDNLLSLFQAGSMPLTPLARLEQREPGTEWLLDDGELEYVIEKTDKGFVVSMGGAGGWIQAQIGFPDGDKVWIDKAATEVMLGRRILHIGTDVTWHDAPIFGDRNQSYTFKLANADLMEHFAYHSAWSQDALNTLFHLISIEKGDIASNVVNASWNLYEMIMKLALDRPSSDVIGFWINWMIPLIGTILASLEGMQTKVSLRNWFIYWFCILLATDLGEKALYSHYLSMARGLFLSTVTLLNQDKDAAGTQPLNHRHIEPWVSGFVDLSLFVLAKAIPRKSYIFPFGSAELTGGYWIGGSLAVGLVGGLLGATAAAGWGRGTFVFNNFLKAGLKGMVWSLARFWPMIFLVKEGDTADGTYNSAGPDFVGYPPGGSGSPYNMPYVADTDILWGQCNQGMFSHHDDGQGVPEVYAFDLAMDQGDPVLNMRPGTVVDYFDWVPDDLDPDATEQAAAAAAAAASGLLVAGQTTSTRRNFITIRHDCDESGNLLADPINDTYDLDQGGAQTVMYANYLHGRQGSVRSVFAARGVSGNAIIGTRVLRGQRIMLAGDTGKSFHNHLHIHIRPGPAPGGFSTDPGGGAGMANRTIPFTFREVDDVPTILNTYTSENTEIP
ncbi:MAG: hypothetical protein IPK19_10875 [Chloroflexi bacterium]|nr:hypothetical protein [Chloroflexota bacterium]